jgi:hypothetical protein
MNRVWGVAVLVIALGATALTWANTSPRVGATHQYRCDSSRHLIALERPSFVSLMFAGRSYDLTWTDASTAQGHGLIWRISNDRASLTRVSSGFTLASGCARMTAQI